MKNSNKDQIERLNDRISDLLRERDDLLKANQVLHNLLTNRESEIAALRGAAQRPLPVAAQELSRKHDWCPACHRGWSWSTVSSTGVETPTQRPLPCPYAIDGCVLENQEVGPCLCANPDLCAVTSTTRSPIENKEDSAS
jgi:hypothetical protein